MVKNIWEKIAENLDYIEKSNFMRRSTELAVDGSSGVI